MIEIKFKDTEIMETLHNALVGSPAYVDSEIAICEDDDGFSLVVGNENDDNCVIEVNDFTCD